MTLFEMRKAFADAERLLQATEGSGPKDARQRLIVGLLMVWPYLNDGPPSAARRMTQLMLDVVEFGPVPDCILSMTEDQVARFSREIVSLSLQLRGGTS